MSKVTVIVPVFNAAGTLSRCVDSILKQDHGDIEVILVDDGSRDGSFDIASAYADADSRVRAVRKENGGVSSARNLGLDMAAGDYIAFADADDWLPMEALKLLAREMEQRDCDMAVGDFFRVMEGRISRKGSIDRGGVITRDAYAGEMMKTPADLYYGVIWNKLYRRDLIERYHVRMEEGVSYGEDMIFNLEYLLHVRTVAVLKVPVYYYIRTPGSLIERNVSINGIINMKRTVIRYYDQFYKKIFDERTYQERRPIILGYYLAFSTDALTLPLIGGAKDLGKERGADLPCSDALRDSVLGGHYLSSQLLHRYLETVGLKRGISLSGMRILCFLWLVQRPCTMEEMCLHLDMTRISVTMLMVHLTGAGLCRRAPSPGRKKQEGFVLSSKELEEELEQMEQDFTSVACEGLEEEEKAVCLRATQIMRANIRRHIAKSTGAEKD